MDAYERWKWHFDVCRDCQQLSELGHGPTCWTAIELKRRIAMEPNSIYREEEDLDDEAKSAGR